MLFICDAHVQNFAPGMGRSIETNLNALFTVDCLRVRDMGVASLDSVTRKLLWVQLTVAKLQAAVVVSLLWLNHKLAFWFCPRARNCLFACPTSHGKSHCTLLLCNMRFMFNVIQVGMIKHPEVAAALGGRLYDCVCKFERGKA